MTIYFCNRRCGFLLGKDFDRLLSLLLESRELRVNVLVMDPYINVDPGTMSPIQHGEVFATLMALKQIWILVTTSVFPTFG